VLGVVLSELTGPLLTMSVLSRAGELTRSEPRAALRPGRPAARATAAAGRDAPGSDG